MMNPEDDQQLWDLLGRAAKPRISPFFARNILRQIRQEPVLSKGAGAWLRWRILAPASGVALAVIAAAMFMRSSVPPQAPPENKPETVAAVDVSKRVPEPAAKIEAQAPPVAPSKPIAKVNVPAKPPEPAVNSNSEVAEPQALAQIDAQDYDVVANLDDLLVLYETSLWDENSSL